jgi:hypothetical protein
VAAVVARAHDEDGNDLEYSEALELHKSQWIPPAGLSFSAMSLPRLPLVSVLNFLAFAADNPPPGMSNLMCAAHRLRAFRALCAAARDGKVKLFGRPRAGGARQGIDPIEFDQPLSLTAEDGAIGFDLDAMTQEQFVELRREPNHWLWRDVYIDRSSLEGWLAKFLSGQEPAGRRGKPPKADWSAIEEAFRREVAERGMPDETNVDGWQRQADVERWLGDILIRERVEVSESTLRRHAKGFLSRARKGS